MNTVPLPQPEGCYFDGNHFVDTGDFTTDQLHAHAAAVSAAKDAQITELRTAAHKALEAVESARPYSNSCTTAYTRGLLDNIRIQTHQSTGANEMKFKDLPELGAPLDTGTFAGITTRQDGTHCAVVLLPTKGEDLTWPAAITWAAEQGGELPTRPVAALLFANVQPALSPGWHWTCEEDDASFAWTCDFFDGLQFGHHKSYEGSAVAVRLIELEA